jgi:hypothetical protein
MTNEERDLTSQEQPQVTPDPVSDDKLSTPISAAKASVAEVLDSPEFQQRLEQLVENKTQSTKDKRFNKVNYRIDEVLEEFEGLKARGFSDEQAKYLMKMQEQTPQSSPAEQLPVSNQPKATVNYEEVITTIGLDARDPGVVNTVMSYLDDEAGLKAALVDLKAAKAKQTPPPSAANVVTPSAPGAKSQDMVALAEEFEQLEKSGGDQKRMDEIVQLMREGGQ